MISPCQAPRNHRQITLNSSSTRAQMAFAGGDLLQVSLGGRGGTDSELETGHRNTVDLPLIYKICAFPVGKHSSCLPEGRRVDWIR